MNTRHFYLLPTPRPTYRIVKCRHWIDTQALEQRWRWLLFEWWVKVEGNLGGLTNLEARRKYLLSLDTDVDREHVVSADV